MLNLDATKSGETSVAITLKSIRIPMPIVGQTNFFRLIASCPEAKPAIKAQKPSAPTSKSLPTITDDWENVPLKAFRSVSIHRTTLTQPAIIPSTPPTINKLEFPLEVEGAFPSETSLSLSLARPLFRLCSVGELLVFHLTAHTTHI